MNNNFSALDDSMYDDNMMSGQSRRTSRNSYSSTLPPRQYYGNPKRMDMDQDWRAPMNDQPKRASRDMNWRSASPMRAGDYRSSMIGQARRVSRDQYYVNGKDPKYNRASRDMNMKRVSRGNSMVGQARTSRDNNRRVGCGSCMMPKDY